MKVQNSSSQICKKFLQLGSPSISIVSLKWDLICGVGGAEADPPTSKMGTFFLMALALIIHLFLEFHEKTHDFLHSHHFNKCLTTCKHINCS